MGIWIKLSVDLDHVTEESWKSVYEESLQLLDAYPFMDAIIDEERFALRSDLSREEVEDVYVFYDDERRNVWSYLVRSKERYLSQHGTFGWSVIGDMETMESAEEFMLSRDLSYYQSHSRSLPEQKPVQPLPCGEIIIALLYEYCDDEWIEDLETSSYSIFESKTQGYDYHCYVLAIALLIESRLPGKAIVYGEISKGQMRKAVEWANTILDRPIQVSERADDEKLFRSLKRVIQDENALMHCFMSITMSEHHSRFGEFLRSHFSDMAIKEYAASRLKRYKIGSFAFRDWILELLCMDFDLRWVIDLCVLEPNGPQYNPEEFVKEMMGLDLHKEESDLVREHKSNLQHSFQKEDSEESDSIGGTFGRIMFMMMTGLSKVSKKYIPAGELRDTLVSMLGSMCPAGDLFDTHLLEEKAHEAEEEKVTDEEIAKAMETFMEVLSEKREEYDITDLEDLKRWKPGDRCGKAIMSNLKILREKILAMIETDKDSITVLLKKNKENRKRKLIRLNRFFYVRKDAWDYMFDHISNDPIYTFYAMLLCINPSPKDVYDIVYALVNNTELFARVFLEEAFLEQVDN